jgi:hypothetical protein
MYYLLFQLVNGLSGGTPHPASSHPTLQQVLLLNQPEFLLVLLNACPFSWIQLRCQWHLFSVYLFTKNQNKYESYYIVQHVVCPAQSWLLSGQRPNLDRMWGVLSVPPLITPWPSKNPHGIYHPVWSSPFLTWLLFLAWTVYWFLFIFWLNGWRWQDSFTYYSQTTKLESLLLLVIMVAVY